MIHWPNTQIPLAQSIASLCKVKKAGLAKNIGVANFNIAMIDEATKLASEPIAVLQIETHPYLDQTKVIAEARRHGMAVVGYCPLARGKVPDDETLQRIGREMCIRDRISASNRVVPPVLDDGFCKDASV